MLPIVALFALIIIGAPLPVKVGLRRESKENVQNAVLIGAPLPVKVGLRLLPSILETYSSQHRCTASSESRIATPFWLLFHQPSKSSVHRFQ